MKITDGLTADEIAEAHDLVDAFAQRIIYAPDGQAGAAREAYLAELDARGTPAAQAVARYIRTARQRNRGIRRGDT